MVSADMVAWVAPNRNARALIIAVVLAATPLAAACGGGTLPSYSPPPVNSSPVPQMSGAASPIPVRTPGPQPVEQPPIVEAPRIPGPQPTEPVPAVVVPTLPPLPTTSTSEEPSTPPEN